MCTQHGGLFEHFLGKVAYRRVIGIELAVLLSVLLAELGIFLGSFSVFLTTLLGIFTNPLRLRKLQLLKFATSGSAGSATDYRAQHNDADDAGRERSCRHRDPLHAPAILIFDLALDLIKLTLHKITGTIRCFTLEGCRMHLLHEVLHPGCQASTGRCNIPPDLIGSALVLRLRLAISHVTPPGAVSALCAGVGAALVWQQPISLRS